MVEYITISDMAKLHNISRQTLIYYDAIGLFQPAMFSEKGYRLYSVYQIPYLREICLLKKLGVPLETIKENMHHRDNDKTTELLLKQKEIIEDKIRQLYAMDEYIAQRIEFYKEMDSEDLVNIPRICELKKRKILVIPFEKKPDKKTLHLTLMKGYQMVYEHDILPASGFGTLLKYDSIQTGDYLLHSGSFINLPYECELKEQVHEIKGGTYVCMDKYGYPYEEEHIRRLLTWIEDNGYEVTGDVLDICLHDTTFYRTNQDVDYCCLQVPVRKKEK